LDLHEATGVLINVNTAFNFGNIIFSVVIYSSPGKGGETDENSENILKYSI
jgi:hypothetical protein